MNEAQMFELLGRKQAQLEEVVKNYGNLIAIVRGIIAGSIAPDRLTIAADGTWSLAPAPVSDNATEKAV